MDPEGADNGGSDEGLYEFLKARGVGEDTIRTMRDEKITCETIILMNDDDLSRYFPAYGDKLAVVSFAKQQEKKEKVNARKRTLFEKLSWKMSRKNETQAGPSKDVQSRNATKQGRKIEVGWMDYNHIKEEYSQVRTKCGGGVRKLTINKEATSRDILRASKELFFPGGISPKGREEEFLFRIMNFNLLEMDVASSVGEVYKSTKFAMLRFYLASKKIEVDDPDSEDDGLPAVDITAQRDLPSTSSVLLPTASTPNPVPEQLDLSEVPVYDLTSSDHEVKFGPLFTDAEVEDLALTLPITRTEEIISYTEAASENPVGEMAPANPVSVMAAANPVGVMASANLVGEMAPAHPVEEMAPANPVGVMASANPVIPDVLTVDEPIVVNRGNMLHDMVDAFRLIPKEALQSETQYTFRIQHIDGRMEAGEGVGVTRDCISFFWEEFFSRCTVGCSVKVPFIRHDLGQAEWQAVAKIIVFGWYACGYFPCQLSPSFMRMAISGSYSSDDLVGEFLNYLSDEEATTLRAAMNEYDSYPQEDITDVLNTYGCRSIPNAENLPTLVAEIAHKELIQSPAFVGDCWSKILDALSQNFDISMVAEQLQPTNRKVSRLFSFSDTLTAAQETTKNHLLRFTRELDAITLKKFLRFCTGSDLLTCDSIAIRFNERSGLSRHPVAHTCGCVLELPVTYDHYPEFRSEFRAVLESGVWAMDIV